MSSNFPKHYPMGKYESGAKYQNLYGIAVAALVLAIIGIALAIVAFFFPIIINNENTLSLSMSYGTSEGLLLLPMKYSTQGNIVTVALGPAVTTPSGTLPNSTFISASGELPTGIISSQQINCNIIVTNNGLNQTLGMVTITTAGELIVQPLNDASLTGMQSPSNFTSGTVTGLLSASSFTYNL